MTLLWRAARRLGIGADAAAPAEAAGLIELGTRVRFRHPLVRAAAYRAATLGRSPGGTSRPGRGDRSRRPIPTAGPGTGPTQRRVPDEEVAAELEWSAGRAQARGGVAAAAAFLEARDRADGGSGSAGTARAGMPPRPSSRRALRTTHRHWWRTAELCPLDELDRTRIAPAAGADRVRVARHGSDAPPLLFEAARRLEQLDVAVGARDVPRGVRGGDLRRSPWPWPGCGGAGRGGPGGAARTAASPGGRPAARRPGVLLHRRLRRGRDASPSKRLRGLSQDSER